MAIYGFSEDKTKREVDEAGKVGGKTVGSASQPIYLNNGKPTAISATAGGENNPVYIKGGVPTAALTVSSGTISFNSGISVTERVLKRYGNVVFAYFYITNNSGSYLKNIGTIPSGYRPSANMKAVGHNMQTGAVVVNISKAGAITIAILPKTAQLMVSTMWII